MVHEYDVSVFYGEYEGFFSLVFVLGFPWIPFAEKAKKEDLSIQTSLINIASTELNISTVCVCVFTAAWTWGFSFISITEH